MVLDDLGEEEAEEVLRVVDGALDEVTGDAQCPDEGRGRGGHVAHETRFPTQVYPRGTTGRSTGGCKLAEGVHDGGVGGEVAGGVEWGQLGPDLLPARRPDLRVFEAGGQTEAQRPAQQRRRQSFTGREGPMRLINPSGFREGTFPRLITGGRRLALAYMAL